MASLDVFREHVRRFNHGVRSGDFGAMLEQFTDDASLVFEGVPAGPFHGKAQIEAAYQSQPPDDEIHVIQATVEDGLVVAIYGWRRDGGIRSGEMRLTISGDRITRLVVTFDQSMPAAGDS